MGSLICVAPLPAAWSFDGKQSVIKMIRMLAASARNFEENGEDEPAVSDDNVSVLIDVIPTNEHRRAVKYKSSADKRQRWIAAVIYLAYRTRCPIG